MKIFNPSASAYNDVFDQSRFVFAWKLYMLLLFVFVGLSVVHGLEQDWPNLIITLSAFVAIGIALIITKSTGKYTFAAIFGGALGSLINQLDLFLITGSQKYVTILWILCITLYVFYLLGTKWGIITLILNITGVAISLVVVPKEAVIQQIESQDNIDKLSMIINLIVITLLMSYLMTQIIKFSSNAEKRSKQTQQELRKQYVIVQSQNEEKTVMLREIHHRVKNNLQVITSLLRLQQKEIDNEDVNAHFNEAVHRVLAMALIHEKMYQSKDLSRIDLTAYLKTFAQELINSYSVNKPIDLDIICEIEYVQPKSLVSFALLFNELMSNSLKHAFTDQARGEINVTIRKINNEEIECIYHDNGKWKAPQRKGSFGVELIQDLTEQLDGKYVLDTNKGTTYTFTFDINNL
ncbi:sensor histidine kinase [Paracrocinitomix mangrovi]|uniref:sensor histidine kinase n=1 Tax=Paracrocinitomix mangrovi TaxID=2862509 RepID=UPI001C8EF02D|nr:sensor histidine kinase [Paracrocinitomix mangrovi]UKN01787.1 sensor histidine kinase [Paracrocinitomix mangrovi]